MILVIVLNFGFIQQYSIIWLIIVSGMVTLVNKRMQYALIWHITTPTNVWARDGCEARSR